MSLPRGGRYAYVADKLSCDVKRIDTSTFQVVDTIGVPSQSGCPFGLAAGASVPVAYVVTGNDKTLNIGSMGRAVERVDFATGTVSTTAFLGGDPVTDTLDPTGTLVYVVDADAPAVELLSAATGVLVGTLALPQAQTAPTTVTSLGALVPAIQGR